jgi:sec-independent protein translocase protein TatC
MAATDTSASASRNGAQPIGGAPTPQQNSAEEPEAVMTLVEHLEELRRRLIVAIIAVAVCTIGAYFFWQQILGFLMLPLPDLSHSSSIMTGHKLVVSDLIGGFMIALKISLAVGIAVASPIVLYQLWGFLAPGLTRNERRYAGPFTFLGVLLFIVGLAVGYLTLRYPIDWLVSFNQGTFTSLLSADSYLTFVTYFLLAFGVVFETPIVITFLGVVGVVNSRMLRRRRMYILFALWVVSCFITPGADPISPIIVGVAFTVLFELSVLLLRIIKK